MSRSASLADFSVSGMIHDIFMVTQIRKIGDKGIYQDKGYYLEEVVAEGSSFGD